MMTMTTCCSDKTGSSVGVFQFQVKDPGGGGIPIHKLYGDAPPFRVWFFDRPLINRVSNSKIFKDFL